MEEDGCQEAAEGNPQQPEPTDKDSKDRDEEEVVAAAGEEEKELSSYNWLVEASVPPPSLALPPGELELLCAGRHPDPATVLGRRVVDQKVLLRVWMVGAKAVSCILNVVADGATAASGESGAAKKARVQLHRVESNDGPSSLFESVLDTADGIPDLSSWDYELEIQWAGGGGKGRWRDPYSFGDLLPRMMLESWKAGKPTDSVAGMFGAHHMELNKSGCWGTRFVVWAPAAEAVSVVGDFNFWNGSAHPMCPRQDFGIWELFVPSFDLRGQKYAYKICIEGSNVGKAKSDASIRIDPFALEFVDPNAEGCGHDARVSWCDDYSRAAWGGEYRWSDETWIQKRAQRADGWERQPLAIYEVHLPSWASVATATAAGRSSGSTSGGDGKSKRPGYRDLAAPLAAHCKELGINCVQFLPLSQYPNEASWGYQCAGGMFAVDSRLGSADDFRFLVDTLHAHSIGVFVDFVGAHFAKDDWGLTYYAGAPQFEYASALGEIPGWGTARYDFSKPEVQAYLTGAADHWIEHFHVDGLRFDAVAAIVYSNFGREEDGDAILQGRGVVNEDGVKFLRGLCKHVRERFPGVLLSAEDSTNFKWVTDRPPVGGTERQRVAAEDLGFHLKWNMGFTYDTLAICKVQPNGRAHMQIFGWKQLAWCMQYAYNERWILPLSHDNSHSESLLDRMCGASREEKLALLQVLMTYVVAMPGRPLLFMGLEVGHEAWSFKQPMDWEAIKGDPAKMRLKGWLSTLLTLYQQQPALHVGDDNQESFSWLDVDTSNQCIYSWRRSAKGARDIVAVVNFAAAKTPLYKIPLPKEAMGKWRCVACTKAHANGKPLPNAIVTSNSGLAVEHLEGLSAQLWLAPTPVQITFELRHAEAKEGTSPRVVGDCDGLGLWKPEAGLALEKNVDAGAELAVWQAQLELPLHLNRLEFKFLTVETDKTVCWESFDGNRMIQDVWKMDEERFKVSADFGKQGHTIDASCCGSK